MVILDVVDDKQLQKFAIFTFEIDSVTANIFCRLQETGEARDRLIELLE